MAGALEGHLHPMPFSLAESYADVVLALDEVETRVRMVALPSMDRRGLFLEAAHDKAASPVLSHDDSTACLCNCGLRNFELSMLASPERQGVALSQIVSLDLSCNELMELPGLEAMPQLEALDLSRNWFKMLPPQVGTLRRLVSLNASRNFLRPNAESLQLAPLKALPALRLLDLSFNQKCGKEELRDRLRAELPLVDELKITVSLELRAAPGAFVGASAAERDPGVLRSQLEPLGTIALRRRLVCDFGNMCAHGFPSKGTMPGNLADVPSTCVLSSTREPTPAP